MPGAARRGRYGRSAAAECRNRAESAVPGRGRAQGSGFCTFPLAGLSAGRVRGAAARPPRAVLPRRDAGNGRGRRRPAGAGAAPSLCLTSSWNGRFYLCISLEVREYLKLRQGSEIAEGGVGVDSVLQTFCFPAGGAWTASEGCPCEVGCCLGCWSAEKRVGTRVQNAACRCRSSAAECRAAPC